MHTGSSCSYLVAMLHVLHMVHTYGMMIAYVHKQAASLPVAYTDNSCPSPAANVAVQGGNYIAGVQPQSLRNLSDYQVFPFSDLQNQYDMNPVLGSCFANGSGLTIPSLVQEVNSCTQKYHICCYNAVNDQVRPDWHSCTQHSGSTSP